MKKIEILIDVENTDFFSNLSKMPISEHETLVFIINSFDFKLSTEQSGRDISTTNKDMPYQSMPSELDITISNYLSKLGLPSGLSGFRYMITAIKKVLSDENILDEVTKVLYPAIAEYHNSTPQRVEKSLRHVISVAWDHNPNLATLKDPHFFVKEGKKYPTNSQFIAEVSRQLKLSLSTL